MLNDYFKATFIAGGLAMFAIVIVFRLLYLQLYKHNFYADMANSQSLAEITLNKNRGIIYDRNMTKLSENVHSASLYVDAYRLKEIDKFMEQLKKYGIYLSSDTKKRIYEKRRFVWIKRGIDIDLARKIANIDDSLQVVINEDRFYPKGDILSNIVGFTGVDNQGLEGVEAFFDKKLRGENVKITILKDSRGNTMVFEDKYLKIKPESEITLSIDADLQKIVSSILYQDLKTFDAKSAVAAAMDVHTGEILFSVSYPTFDGNNFSKYSKKLWKEPLFYYLFEPGSIFKAATFAALFENGLLTENKVVDCENGKYRIAGHIFNDVKRHKLLRYDEVFAHSSNIGTIKLTESLDSKKFYESLKRYGFGDTTNPVGFTDETGLVRDVKNWSLLSKPSVSIGQEVLVTPIQMLRFYSAIANGGYLVTPTILKMDVKGKEQIFSKKTSEFLKDLLIKVVNEGTGQNAKSEFFQIAGKTGTAQKFDNDAKKYSKTDYNASFIGFFPADNPKFAVIVLFDSPKKSIYGGSTAAYTFKKIVHQMAIHYKLGIKRIMVKNEIRKAS
jgi:cell division protein FtsI (penicillin-binding protein 3)